MDWQLRQAEQPEAVTFEPLLAQPHSTTHLTEQDLTSRWLAKKYVQRSIWSSSVAIPDDQDALSEFLLDAVDRHEEKGGVRQLTVWLVTVS